MLVYLHAGIDKTGTTALQAALWLNRTWLTENGVHLVRTGAARRSANHGQLIRDLDGQLGKQLGQELSEAKAGGAKAILLSWEGIAALKTGKLQKLRDQFAGCDVLPVIYLREQAEITQSGYFQRLKEGTVSEGVDALFGSDDQLTQERRNYQELLSKFAGVFGADALRVRRYHKGFLLNSDVVEDFLQTLGLTKDAGFRGSGYRRNSSLDRVTAQYLLEAEKNGLGHDEREALVDELMEYVAINGPTGRYFLDKEQVCRLREGYRESNQQVARQFFGTDSLFPNAGACCVDSEKPGDIDESAASLRLRDWLKQRSAIPIWDGSVLEGKDLQLVASRGDGWQKANESGVSTSGADAKLQFRVLYRSIPPAPIGLVLKVRGTYSHKTAGSWVRINEGPQSIVSLDYATIFVPADVLSKDAVVTVRLRLDEMLNERGKKAKSADEKDLSFSITLIKYRLLSEGDFPADWVDWAPRG